MSLFFYKTLIHFHDSSSSPWTERRGRFYICLVWLTALSAVAPTPITTIPNLRHPLMGHLLKHCPLDYTFWFVFWTQKQIPTQMNFYIVYRIIHISIYAFIYIYTGLPSFNSPPRPSYITSLQMSTVIHLPLVVCPTTTKTGHCSQQFIVNVLLSLQASAFTTVQCQKTKKIKYANNQLFPHRHKQQDNIFKSGAGGLHK